MSSKTKIIVLHAKELIYTAIFVALGILLILLLVFMFLPKNTTDTKQSEDIYGAADAQAADKYVPGIYTSSIILNNTAIDIEVAVDESHINSIRLINLDDAVATMYPLIEPSLDELISQIYENQSLEGISYSDDNKYTSMVLLEAIDAALGKAANIDKSNLAQ